MKLPAEQPREQIIKHKGFTLSYNSSYVAASWLTYMVENASVDKEAKLKEKFVPDPQVNTRAADKKDFKDGSYIMGQMASPYDFLHIEGAVEETFYTTNVAAMKSAFYTHIWLKGDDLIRAWVGKKGPLQVITGVNLNDTPFKTLGENKVIIPAYFYKVVYDDANKEAVAFWFKNGMASGTLKSKAMSVKQLEAKIGIDLFPFLDEETKTKVKSEVNYEFWDFALEKEL